MAAVCPCPVCSRGGDHGSLLLVLAIGAVVALAAWLSSWAGWQRWWMTPIAVVVLVAVSLGVVAAVKASFAVSPYVGEVETPAATGQRVTGPSLWTSGSAESPSPTPVDELATRRAKRRAA